MNIYIDESGSINNHALHNNYFIIALVRPIDKVSLKRAYKRFVSSNYQILQALDQDKYHPKTGLIIKERGKMFSNGTFEYPIFFDIEHKTQLALSEDLVQKIAIAFCEELEKAGYWVGIYSYKYFLESNFTPEILNRYAVWVAHTGVSQTNFKYPYGIWQHSHTGKVNGIKSNVDLNYAYVDYPYFMKKAGLNGF